MLPVHALDSFYLGITVLITTGYQLLGFAIAWTFQFDKITDFTGGELFSETRFDFVWGVGSRDVECLRINV